MKKDKQTANPTVVGYMNSHDGKLCDSKDACLFWKQRARALELMTVAEHEQIAAPLLQQIAELERICGEAYQVVGSLLSDVGAFETPEAEKILDNLSQAKMVHEDVLPWPTFVHLSQIDNEVDSMRIVVGAVPVAEVSSVSGNGPNDVGVRWRGLFAQKGELLYRLKPSGKS